jgi:hypothetical protein
MRGYAKALLGSPAVNLPHFNNMITVKMFRTARTRLGWAVGLALLGWQFQDDRQSLGAIGM